MPLGTLDSPTNAAGKQSARAVFVRKVESEQRSLVRSIGRERLRVGFGSASGRRSGVALSFPRARKPEPDRVDPFPIGPFWPVALPNVAPLIPISPTHAFPCLLQLPALSVRLLLLFHRHVVLPPTATFALSTSIRHTLRRRLFIRQRGLQQRG